MEHALARRSCSLRISPTVSNTEEDLLTPGIPGKRGGLVERVHLTCRSQERLGCTIRVHDPL